MLLLEHSTLPPSPSYCSVLRAVYKFPVHTPLHATILLLITLWPSHFSPGFRAHTFIPVVSVIRFPLPHLPHYLLHGATSTVHPTILYRNRYDSFTCPPQTTVRLVIHLAFSCFHTSSTSSSSVFYRTTSTCHLLAYVVLAAVRMSSTWFPSAYNSVLVLINSIRLGLPHLLLLISYMHNLYMSFGTVHILPPSDFFPPGFLAHTFLPSSINNVRFPSSAFPPS